MPKHGRRLVRRFIYKDDDGLLIDYDCHLPKITTPKRERHCRGVYYDKKKELVLCHRIISRKIPTLTIDGLTGFRKPNPHHYCPRCANILLTNMRKKLLNELKKIKEIENSKKNKRDIKMSEEKWKWEKIFH